MCVPTVCGLKLVKFDISLFPYPDKMNDRIFLSWDESEANLSFIIFMGIYEYRYIFIEIKNIFNSIIRASKKVIFELTY